MGVIGGAILRLARAPGYPIRERDEPAMEILEWVMVILIAFSIALEFIR